MYDYYYWIPSIYVLEIYTEYHWLLYVVISHSTSNCKAFHNIAFVQLFLTSNYKEHSSKNALKLLFYVPTQKSQ